MNQMNKFVVALQHGQQERQRRQELARKNIEAFEGSEDQILTSCASCSSHLKKYPALFEDEPKWRERSENFSKRVREFTSFVNENAQEGVLEGISPARVYYHEPCHLRFDKENSGSAHQLRENIENISRVDPE